MMRYSRPEDNMLNMTNVKKRAGNELVAVPALYRDEQGFAS